MKLIRLFLGIAMILALPLNLSAQSITVKGSVKDDGGLGVIGASVVQQGTQNGVITDIDGNYSISVPSTATLVFSSIGYKDEVVAVAGKASIDVILHEDNELLEEVVVIGYGVQKKSDVTGAIASVGKDALENRSVNDVASALAGKTAGVMVLSSSGRPGEMGTIRVRGVSSNSSGSTEPLYIVDGHQVSGLSSVEPSNIESIEVLKDASSAAIYGAQAGNGVVLITTKSGVKGEGSVFYNGSYTIENLAWKPNMMNAKQYVDFETAGGYLTDSVINDYWNGKTDTDWFKEMLPGGSAQRHTIGAQTATDKGSFFVSLTSLSDDGILVTNRDQFDRLNFQLNADYKIKNWLKIGTNNTFTHSKQRYISSMGGGDTSIAAMIYNMDPLTEVTYAPGNLPSWMQQSYDLGSPLLTDENGNYIATSEFQSRGFNPLIYIYRHQSSWQKHNSLHGSLYATLTPIKGLSYTSRLGYTLSVSDNYHYEAPWFNNSNVQNPAPNLNHSVGYNLDYQWENFANYSHTFARKHNFDAMVGMSWMERNGMTITGSTNSLTDYAENFRFLSYQTADADDSVSGAPTRRAQLAYFSRLGYNFDNRYFIQASFRADAFDSSYLSAANRWGYFPSVSLGWTISNEPFMANVNKAVLSFLKARLSWGTNGNINALGDYRYASTVSIGATNYQFGTDMEHADITLGSYPSSLSNPNLKWETSKQVDAGIDARMLSDRLVIGFDYYNKNTDDLLVAVVPPYTSGQNSTYLNSGSVRNQGFEFEISWKDNIGDFSYGISANVAHNSNNVTFLDPSVTRINGTQINGKHYATVFQQGYPVWYMRGYKFTGIDPEDGTPSYEDINGDGSITDEDCTMIGSALPDFTYGITLTAAWKGLDLTVFGTGSQGNDIWFAGMYTNNIQRNLPTAFYEQAWKKAGDVVERFPKYSALFTGNYTNSSAMIFDGSYFRISQIQLGYTLPKKWLEAVKAKNIRVYASLDDYFTFSKYIGFDPVTAGADTGKGMGIDRGNYPSSKKAMFGVNLSF